jgi:hypothetical protein
MGDAIAHLPGADDADLANGLHFSLLRRGCVGEAALGTLNYVVHRHSSFTRWINTRPF